MDRKHQNLVITLLVLVLIMTAITMLTTLRGYDVQLQLTETEAFRQGNDKSRSLVEDESTQLVDDESTQLVDDTDTQFQAY